VPFPDTVVLAGDRDVMSPLFVAVISVLFAFVIVTTENVFGLPFFGNERLEGADNTHGGGVGDEDGDVSGYGDGEVPGDGSGSASGSGEGSSPGDGDGSSSGEGDAASSGEGLGDSDGSTLSLGLGVGDPNTTVDGFELSVISPIESSGKISVPIVTSPEPDKLTELGSRPS
jgi:hypothetical protein